MQRQAQIELRRARALRIRAIRELQLAKAELGRARAFHNTVAIRNQSEAADVDHGVDSDSVRYVPDSLAVDTYVPDSFEDADEEAQISTIATEKEKDEKACAIVRAEIFKIVFPNFPELHK